MRKTIRSGLIFLVALALTAVSVDKLAIQPAVKKEREKASYAQKLKNQELWTLESRFDNYAKNQRGSSAYGIAQLLGETDSRPEYQILRGLKYIQHRYKTPCKALQFHLRNGHY